MSIPKPQQVPQAADQASALDLVVKYAVVLTWLVYAVGLTKISGFLGTLTVPMDPDFYALPRVLSSGGFAVLEIVLGAAIGLFCMNSLKKETPRIAEYAGMDTSHSVHHLDEAYSVGKRTPPAQTQLRFMCTHRNLCANSPSPPKTIRQLARRAGRCGFSLLCCHHSRLRLHGRSRSTHGDGRSPKHSSPAPSGSRTRRLQTRSHFLYVICPWAFQIP